MGSCKFNFFLQNFYKAKLNTLTLIELMLIMGALIHFVYPYRKSLGGHTNITNEKVTLSM